MDYYLNKYIFKKKENENINLNQVPYIMLSNFESLTEKQCLKADKNNKKVYKKLLESVEKAHKEVRNTGLFLNLEAPLPPHPSNRDRFLLWKRRNVNHHVITQSEAVLFLNENGYKLNEHYEAYQAIELSKEIKRNKGIPVDNSEILESKNFDNVYTTQDKNIFRRRSMYGKTQFTNTRNKFNDIVINSDFDEKPKIQAPAEVSPNGRCSSNLRASCMPCKIIEDYQDLRRATFNGKQLHPWMLTWTDDLYF